MKTTLLITLLLGLPCLGRTKPNVIVILADDVGVECFNSYGGESYKTPNMDKMSESGAQFQYMYAQPICTPTRVQLMTGKYNHRNYVQFRLLARGEKTFGHYFRDKGYKTYIAGKWQLGEEDGVKLIDEFGFDEHLLFHYKESKKSERYLSPTLIKDEEAVDYPGKYGPKIVRFAIKKFIKEQAEKNQPFFVYYPMFLVHSPFNPTQDSEDWDPDADQEEVPDDPDKYFPDMMEYMDKNVGSILDLLEELDIAENTLVLFMGDNGTHGKITSIRDGEKVKGGKGSTKDAGTHVPLLAWWPGTIDGGTVIKDPTDVADILPSICEAAGIDVDDPEVDGKSFYKQITGKSDNPHKTESYCWYDRKSTANPPEVFVHNARYKLYSTGEFYRKRSDLLEEHPVAKKDMSEGELRTMERFQEILDSYKKTSWTGPDGYRSFRNTTHWSNGMPNCNITGTAEGDARIRLVRGDGGDCSDDLDGVNLILRGHSILSMDDENLGSGKLKWEGGSIKLAQSAKIESLLSNDFVIGHEEYDLPYTRVHGNGEKILSPTSLTIGGNAILENRMSRLVVGRNGTAIVDQEGGTVTVGGLSFADGTATGNRYSLSGGTLSIIGQNSPLTYGDDGGVHSWINFTKDSTGKLVVGKKNYDFASLINAGVIRLGHKNAKTLSFRIENDDTSGSTILRVDNSMTNWRDWSGDSSFNTNANWTNGSPASNKEGRIGSSHVVKLGSPDKPGSPNDLDQKTVSLYSESVLKIENGNFDGDEMQWEEGSLTLNDKSELLSKLTGNFVIGYGETAKRTVLNVNDQSVFENKDSRLVVGRNGPATVNQNSGLVNVQSLKIGTGTATGNRYNLSGGTLMITGAENSLRFGPDGGEQSWLNFPAGSKGIVMIENESYPLASLIRSGKIRIANRAVPVSAFHIDNSVQGQTSLSLYGYWEWIDQFPKVGSMRDPGDDWDGDGVANLWEFAYSLADSPVRPDQGNSVILRPHGSVEGGGFALCLRRADILPDSLSIAIEGSHDLKTWTKLRSPDDYELTTHSHADGSSDYIFTQTKAIGSVECYPFMRASITKPE